MNVLISRDINALRLERRVCRAPVRQGRAGRVRHAGRLSRSL